jgi:BNR/Asp-box repeat
VRRRLAVLGVLALAACGEEAAETPPAAQTPTPNPTVEQPEATPPPESSAANAFIGSIAVDPRDGTLFLGTGLGLYRAEGKSAEKVVGELRTPEGSGQVSSNLVIRFRGPGELLASGHPEGPGDLPENLGLMRSRDGGKQWEPISKLGEADYHVLQAEGDRVLGVHVESPDVDVSGDGGRTFQQRTPPAPPVDAAFDPRDPARMVVSTADGVFTSSDEGRSWRPRDTVPESQLVWARDALYRADPGGVVMASTDGGETWEERGTVNLTVNELAVDADGALYASVPGGEVRRSRDGGATWRRYLRLE